MPPRKRAPLKSVSGSAGSTAPKPAAPPPSADLRSAVAASITAMPWLDGSDAAITALAQRLAEQIEEAQDRADELGELLRSALVGGELDLYKRVQKLEAMCNVTKLVGWLGPQLQGVLRDLGGTPAARLAMRKDKPVGGRLAQLRDAAGRAEK